MQAISVILKLQKLRASIIYDIYRRVWYSPAVTCLTAGEAASGKLGAGNSASSTACQVAPRLRPPAPQPRRAARRRPGSRLSPGTTPFLQSQKRFKALTADGLRGRRKAGARSQGRGRAYRPPRSLFSPRQPGTARSDPRSRPRKQPPPSQRNPHLSAGEGREAPNPLPLPPTAGLVPQRAVRGRGPHLLPRPTARPPPRPAPAPPPACSLPATCAAQALRFPSRSRPAPSSPPPEAAAGLGAPRWRRPSVVVSG